MDLPPTEWQQKAAMPRTFVTQGTGFQMDQRITLSRAMDLTGMLSKHTVNVSADTYVIVLNVLTLKMLVTTIDALWEGWGM